ncbi:hypothetical protein CUJ83_10920 [Methanocella sp. CWC-04]|uniref:Peptidase family M50 n=1 Tax=Methanooceanicella nereidis TaxID=2052831 RepID=A0AAP2W7X3_9EURY|nr:metalloprotease [Methanocella sp. CWC-04]MCD1295511.1 hypothetical protein [Methanocella sp. CWC-04]
MKRSSALIPVIIFIILFSWVSVAYSQAVPEKAWDLTFGGLYEDRGFGIVKAPDGGYVSVGTTVKDSSSSTDIFILKTDSDGNIIWNKTIGGPRHEWVYHLIRDSDGNYVLAGTAMSSKPAATWDVLLIKFDDNGNIIWQKEYDTDYIEVAFNVAETSDNNYVVTGYIYPDPRNNRDSQVILIKVDKNGDQIWKKTYGGSSIDWGKYIVQTSEGGFLITGWSESFGTGDRDVYVIKTDKDGNLVWQENYGGTANDMGYCGIETSDGYLIGGHTASMGAGMDDIYLLKIRKNDGSVIWEKTYGGAGTDVGCTIMPVKDHFIVAGSTSSKGNGGSDYYVFRIDGNGNQIWDLTYGFEYEDACAGFYADENTIALTGLSRPDNTTANALLVKYGQEQETSAPVDPVAPVAAVVVGSSVGLLGLLWGKISGALNIEGRLSDIFKKVYDFVFGYVKTHVKALLFRKESQMRKVQATQRHAFLLGFSSYELLIFAIASVMLGISYMIAKGEALLPNFIAIYVFTGGVALILHDLAHRYFAHKYRAVSEYKFWGLGTIAMFLTAFFFGIVYALPARTVINNQKDLKQNELGTIFLAGPAVSFVIALVFLAASALGGIFWEIGMLGFSMNLLSAVYSLMPFDPMDGNKVLKWDKVKWGAIFVPVLVIYLIIKIFMP